MQIELGVTHHDVEEQEQVRDSPRKAAVSRNAEMTLESTRESFKDLKLTSANTRAGHPTA